MSPTIESALRFINLTTAGLLAGSLGFGDVALFEQAPVYLPRPDAGPAAILGVDRRPRRRPTPDRVGCRGGSVRRVPTP